jgi:hypothetical protein
MELFYKFLSKIQNSKINYKNKEIKVLREQVQFYGKQAKEFENQLKFEKETSAKLRNELNNYLKKDVFNKGGSNE